MNALLYMLVAWAANDGDAAFLSATRVRDQEDQPPAGTASTSDSDAEMEAEFADDPTVQKLEAE